jgi:hypothetical protein
VVLIHGFGDVVSWSGTWTEVEKVLSKEAGVPKSNILKLQIPLLTDIQDRTDSAIRQITEKFAGEDVHLIAHSLVCLLLFLIVG